MRKKTKFLFLRASIILLFVILSGRIWYVQVVMGSYYKQKADTSKIRLEPVQALRGIVYDRKGVPLVWNAPSWNVTIVPHGISDQGAASVYRLLSRLLKNDPSASQIAQRVLDNQWRAYAPVQIKANIPAQTAMIIKQLHGRLPGVRADPSSIRQYLRDGQDSLAHILGYTSEINQAEYASDQQLYPREQVQPNDQAGRDGVEMSMDAYLHGVNSTDEVEVDSGERPVRTLQYGHAMSGDKVYLTIDSSLQSKVAADLKAALDKLGLRRGVAIVEDVRTGAILSMVSLPSYNNNWFSTGTGISNKRYNSLLTDPAHPLDNMVTSGIFPPGSTYKIITATAALQTHVADVSRMIYDGGSIRLCSVYVPTNCPTFYGWKAGGLGPMNIVSALAQSSDIYFYTVAGGNPTVDPNMPRVGATRLAHYARLFGLGTPTGIELPGETGGLVPTPAWFDHLPVGLLRGPGESWHIGDTYNMAIGQGKNEATPLQMVNVAATVANGGVLYQPRIVNSVVGQVSPRRGVLPSAHTLEPFVPTIIRRDFIDPTNLALIQEGMHESVDLPGYTGTSYAVRDPRIDAAGKTGTSEASGGPHAWWEGYAPFTHPKVAVLVLVPNANAEGAYVAAPIAHKIFEDYFGLPSSKPNWLDDVQQKLVTSTGAQ